MTVLPSPFLNSGSMPFNPDEASGFACPCTGPEADISLIAEIFAGAEKLRDPEARFVLDVERFMNDIDEPPLFLQMAV